MPDKTREDAERDVWDQWSRPSAGVLRYEVRLEPGMTEEYEWGWVVVLGPARPEECQREYPHYKFAYERREGRSYPVGTKGVWWALVQLEVFPECRTRAEYDAACDRLLTPLGQPDSSRE
jgi:hypothetical protein